MSTNWPPLWGLSAIASSRAFLKLSDSMLVLKLICRNAEETYDSKIIAEATHAYEHFFNAIRSKSVVLDVGANIGAVSIEAALRGAKRVVGYEAFAENYVRFTNHCQLNGVQDTVECQQMALTCSNDDTIELTLSPVEAKGTGGGSFLSKSSPCAI